VPILVALNGLRPPYVIQPGQSLTLAEPAPERQYQVQHGDTLSAIAERFDTTVSDLALRNALRRPYVIQPGQTLTLPPASPQAGLPERLSDGRLSLATMACPRYSQAA
jgi:spore germination protein